ncbi:uncharacterized protein [Anoplolepis gracilipes]|uniref:uncharacterized protein n=1 Tax=Anoplolepis gracilipes TaxID=354296 RepID=UPI003B9E9E5F
MSKTISILQTPFQNLKLITMLNKILGLLSCKLVKGRLKSSVWGRYYCILWILIHCTYTGVFYYEMYIASFEENLKVIIFETVRFTAFTASLVPYNCVAAFWDQDLVKFSNILETYDDRVRALGHERKDKHIFIWLFFVLTTCDLIRKTYEPISKADGTTAIIKAMFEEIIPFIVGTNCIFLTGIFLDLIGQRFRHLNEKIIPHVSQLPVTGSPSEITVYDVRYLHGVLLNSADQINRLYGIGTFFTSLSLMLDFIKNLYLMATQDADNDVIVVSVDLLFQSVYLYGMYQFTTYEANRVEDRVLKYGLSFQNKKCRLDKIEMMLYFYHRRYTFTAAAFYVLDITVLFSVYLSL